uniref:Pyridoxal phosphate phosphatase n=1 Tax=Zeugodacus cucurbitae TaxID=28588 RepID=A0A0A1XNC5_ZEUCU
MNKKTKNLMELTKAEFSNWLNSFDTVFSDCDGVLWTQGLLISQPIDGVPEAIALFKSLGKDVYFVTNNGIVTRHEIWEKTRTFGLDIDETRIIAPIQTIIDFLKARNFQQKVYVLGPEAIRTSLSEAGIESFGVDPELVPGKIDDYSAQQVVATQDNDVGAVVVTLDVNFTYAKLWKATNYISSNADCHFISTNLEAVHCYPEYCVPGTGALLSAVESCVERKALQLGKPNPEICQALIKSGKVVPGRTLMIGDTCEIDVLFGHRCGFQTLLVGTGPSIDHELKEVLQNPNANPNYIPDFFVPSLGDIMKLV